MNIKIAVIGLGYVGLPLARLFATKYPVVGFDINKQRVAELMTGLDSTLEVDEQTLQSALLTENPVRVIRNNSCNLLHCNSGLYCTTDLDQIKNCNFYVVTVPTPVDKNNRPDLSPLIKASETVGRVISKGDIVVYESTVYPGATEEDCIPVISSFSGYSPDRINPGDKEHTIEKIKKITSGATPETGIKVDAVYRSVITAAPHS